MFFSVKFCIMLLFGEAEASSAEEQLVRGITEPTEKMVRMSVSGLLSQSSLLQMPKKTYSAKPFPLSITHCSCHRAIFLGVKSSKQSHFMKESLLRRLIP